MRADCASMTDPGRRRARNEDAHAVLLQPPEIARSADQEDPQTLGWLRAATSIVADGIAGPGNGDTASAEAVEQMFTFARTILPWVNDAARDHAGVGDKLERAVIQAHQRLGRIAIENGLDRRMGTTLTFCHVLDGTAHIAHAGDSRAYLLRRGELTQITRDHTLATFLREQYRAGILGDDPHDEIEIAPRASAGRRRAAEVIARQASHMAQILEDLLDVSRMREDRIEMRRELLDLRDLLRDVRDEVVPQADKRGVALEVMTPDEPLRLKGDKTRLRQLLANLMANALKYTPADRSVTLSVSRDDHCAVIQVADQGIGIEPEFLEEIFEPFIQESRQPADTQGMGLGLALVKAIALAHGGEVQAFSPGRDQGSRFVVRLPLIPPAPSAPLRPAIARDGRHRVLLVEDQVDNRELLALALERCGYEVTAVATAGEAIAIIEKTPPNTAVVDIGLPDQPGHAVARRARELYDGQSLQLIALTGHGQQKDRDELKEAGFDHHLVKPTSLALLRSVIDGEESG